MSTLRRRVAKSAAAEPEPKQNGSGRRAVGPGNVDVGPSSADVATVVASVVFDALGSPAERVVVFGTDAVAAYGGALAAIAKAAETGLPWVVQIDGFDGVAGLRALARVAKSVFVSELAEGVAFASSEPIEGGALALAGELVADRTALAGVPAADVAAVRKSFAGEVRVVARKDDGEERYALGVVLEPEVEDSQGDIYSAGEIRTTAFGFMENYQQLGLQHSQIVTGKLKILESYIAPCDFGVGEQSVKAGSWLMGIRVVDDELWSQVKAGDYTGFSIGGSAVRTPVE